MTCSKSIIECLRDKNIQPIAFANVEKPGYIAPNAIDYTSNNYFYSGCCDDYYWAVDFKHNITLEKYQIKDPESDANYIYSWNAYASYDNVTYDIIDTVSRERPQGKNYSIDVPKTLRYFKIFGRNVNDARSFSFEYIKFYGATIIKKTKLCQCTCNSKRIINYNLAKVIILCCK